MVEKVVVKEEEDLPKSETLEEAKKKFQHMKDYLDSLQKEKIEVPDYMLAPDRSMGKLKEVNVIYPVGDPLFIHVLKRKGATTQYNVIQPALNDEENKLYDKVTSKLVDVAYKEPVPERGANITEVLMKLLNTIVATEDSGGGLFAGKKMILTKAQYDKIVYFLIRDRVGFGKLQPLFFDSLLEDIHCTGVGNITTVHKIFGMVYTNIVFDTDRELNQYIVETTERVERLASDRKSVVDAIMPDGSRSNFIYGRDISLEGSSFTIRKFSKVPVSITQLINWGTISAELAAYLWICLENGMNMFVCGETASGKTTTLNAASAFIKPDAKIYTVENTPEVTMPHDIWQHLVTRESGTSSDVNYIDLLTAALRSRPNYIIIGEIRGVEGNVAFQAMQTGHPVMSTFHAGNVQTMIQRITGDPINVPISFVDNLNIALIQQAVYKGGKFIRRVLSVSELERYYGPANKVITREVFTWNSTTDDIIFRGLFNSYLLEQKIAKMQGLKDPREIYHELAHRKKILQRMVEEKIFNYFDVWDILKKYYTGGDEQLPFKL